MKSKTGPKIWFWSLKNRFLQLKLDHNYKHPAMEACKQRKSPILGVMLLFSCCVSVAISTRAQDNFYFDPAPVDESATEGDAALLRCDVSNRKHIAFYWELDARPVTNTSRRYQDDSDLRITRVDRNKDAGSFRCIATNVTTGVSLRSTEARLNILCKYTLFLNLQ